MFTGLYAVLQSFLDSATMTRLNAYKIAERCFQVFAMCLLVLLAFLPTAHARVSVPPSGLWPIREPVFVPAEEGEGVREHLPLLEETLWKNHCEQSTVPVLHLASRARLALHGFTVDGGRIYGKGIFFSLS